jgi:radical SAM protein with 4Fe4S-binding SPASM domain
LLELHKPHNTQMTFCYAPWTNVEILPNGDILPCCKFQQSKHNIARHSINEYRDSDFLAEIKQEFSQGTWPQGCNRCKIEESANVKSKRILDYERYQTNYDEYNLNSEEILTLSLAIGNVCNLKCIICGPASSSKWTKEYQDIYGITIQPNNQVRKDLINGITTLAPNLIHLDIHGGEPFLSNISQHLELLDYYIKNDQAKNITIHYTTNGQIWPDNTFISKWSKFKHIDLQISIDGVGDRYEYLRYPASWDVLNSNIVKFLQFSKSQSNIQISVAHTVSVFNIFYLDEFVSWCYNVGLPTPWLGKLHHPHHLQCTVWPETIKKIIISKLQTSKFDIVKNWATLLSHHDDSSNFLMFQQFVKNHDSYRQLDFKKTFSELASYL